MQFKIFYKDNLFKILNSFHHAEIKENIFFAMNQGFYNYIPFNTNPIFPLDIKNISFLSFADYFCKHGSESKTNIPINIFLENILSLNFRYIELFYSKLFIVPKKLIPAFTYLKYFLIPSLIKENSYSFYLSLFNLYENIYKQFKINKNNVLMFELIRLYYILSNIENSKTETDFLNKYLNFEKCPYFKLAMNVKNGLFYLITDDMIKLMNLTRDKNIKIKFDDIFEKMYYNLIRLKNIKHFFNNSVLSDTSKNNLRSFIINISYLYSSHKLTNRNIKKILKKDIDKSLLKKYIKIFKKEYNYDRRKKIKKIS